MEFVFYVANLHKNLQMTSWKMALQFSCLIFQFSCIYKSTLKFSFFSGFSSLYLFFLHQGIFIVSQLDTLIEKYCFFHLTYEEIVKTYSYCVIILRLFAYCLIISSFVPWLSRTNNSLSKISIVFLLSRFLSCILLYWSGLKKLL